MVAAVVLFWFQPQQLLIDERVDEPELPSAGPAVALSGKFASLDHPTSGRARLVESTDGERTLRLEDFETDNGPDLYVYLSENDVDGDEQGFDDEYVSLGRLKGNLGDQNYEVPDDVDLERYRSVVIWCDRFNSAFGAAPLVLQI